jgi:uncharacterized phage protein (TIGR01671 family)
MRTIKFRWWDTEENEIIDWEQISPLSQEDFTEELELRAMQFTGLKDKNGKEIYEGDIFHCNKVNYVLRFLKLGGAYTVHKIEDETDERFLFHCNEQLEVIGNIYENPELLASN